MLPIQRKGQVLFVYHVLESPRVSEVLASPRPASPRPRVPRPRPLLVTAWKMREQPNAQMKTKMCSV